LIDLFQKVAGFGAAPRGCRHSELFAAGGFLFAKLFLLRLFAQKKKRTIFK